MEIKSKVVGSTFDKSSTREQPLWLQRPLLDLNTNEQWTELVNEYSFCRIRTLVN